MNKISLIPCIDRFDAMLERLHHTLANRSPDSIPPDERLAIGREFIQEHERYRRIVDNIPKE